MNLTRMRRLLRILGLLQAGRGYNASQLAQECRVSRRTIFRDLDVLREAEVPLHFDAEQEKYRVPGTYYLPPTNFTAEEALAVIVLCHELGDDTRLPFYAPARSAALKLESALPSRLREKLADVTGAIRIRLAPHNNLAEHRPIYEQLLSAISQKQAIRIEYDSLTEGKRTVTKLHPYQLLFSRRAWYVIGRSSVHRATRTFHVGRILQAELLSELFRPPRGFSLDRYLRNAWHLIPEPGPDLKVAIRFEKSVARNVAEVNWHKTQQIVWHDNGSLDFHVTVSGLSEISWWILGYGDQAEVLEPPELRTLVAQRARRLLDRYHRE